MNTINIRGTFDAATSSFHCHRLSDNVDIIPVVQNPEALPLKDGKRYGFYGKIIREKDQVKVVLGESYNIDSLGLAAAKDSTELKLGGEIVRIYPVRRTNKGKELQDFLIKSEGQILKVVCFEPCPDFIVPGVRVVLNGRLQSRDFIQATTFKKVERRVYEIALKNLEVIKVEGNEEHKD